MTLRVNVEVPELGDLWGLYRTFQDHADQKTMDVNTRTIQLTTTEECLPAIEKLAGNAGAEIVPVEGDQVSVFPERQLT